MKIGIIGAGWIAEKMALSLQAKPQDCEVYAIASRSIEKQGISHKNGQYPRHTVRMRNL